MILGFDTSSEWVSVAVGDGTGVLAARRTDEPMKHAELLAPLITEVLAEAALVVADLTQIAVGVGPGPFTGLRVGIVTARTLGHVLGVPVVGVCSLDLIAAEVVEHGRAAGEAFGVATDARRKEVYCATYDGLGRRISGPLVEKPAVVATDRLTAGIGTGLYPGNFPHPIEPGSPDASFLIKAVCGGVAELLDPTPLYLRRPDAQPPGAPKVVS